MTAHAGPSRPTAPSTRAVGYAYPWDFHGDPAAAHRARALGLDAVAVAAAYHSVRSASPLHPARRLTEVPHAASYVPVREDVWRGRRLRPAPAGWLPSADPFGDACRALHGVGLDVYAWTVLTHNSHLGRSHPDLTVRNAYGEHYSYALCPSWDEVTDYCVTLVGEVVENGRPDGLVLEACGPLGAVHGSHHDKAGLAGWSTTDQQLLSLCFCDACGRRYTGAGLDPAHVAARVRSAVGRPGPADSVEDVLGLEVAHALRAVRGTTVGRLGTAAAERARAADPGVRLVLHAAPDPWATGAFAAVGSVPLPPVDVLVASCWDPGPAGETALRGLRALAGPGTAVGGYLQADSTWGADGVADRVARYRAAGMEELHLYHLGLVGDEGLRLMAAILAAAGLPADRGAGPRPEV
ncbi:hypothetical protein OG689_36605 [Kitasatospora sp. NBC_00240]|uniref:hypothetical protein n=1 Tax=Kitasatospora sp. NBC_00240 TaxID=2903567 RepID=UPI00224FC3CC|nr:hypothetical protein [Kitasatospora sp. NBC_00240]MCX5214719.1 hypothetical protein [Kitasatospora sp. NBC_00240]